MITRQQGDVLLHTIDALPKGCSLINKVNGRIVVMHGESGHTHVVEDAEALFYEKEGKFYLTTTKSVILKHEEHTAQTLEPGIWEIGQVIEKDWLQGMTRKVVD